MAVSGNWVDLPKELLEEISKCLNLYVDHVRLRAVCVSWRSALSNTLNQLPRQFPLLMFPCDSRGETTYEFFSIAENKSYFIDFPLKMSKKDFFFISCHGWLVFKEKSSIGLFNPFTKAHKDLPSINTSPNLHYLFKVVLSASPSSSDFLAVALLLAPLRLSICRYGDRSWTTIEEGSHEHVTLDVIFYKQQIVTLRQFGEVVIREVICGSGDSTIKINIKNILQQPHLGSIFADFHSFLVEYDDDLVVIFEDELLPIAMSLVVYKLDWNKNNIGIINAKWSKLESLGDKIYFPNLSPHSYFSISDFPRFRGNCVYFGPSFWYRGVMKDLEGQDFPMFDLADKQVKPWPAYPQGVINWEKKRISWISPSPV